MRSLVRVLPALALTACFPSKPVPLARPAAPPAAKAETSAIPPPSSPPPPPATAPSAAPLRAATLTSRELSGIVFEGVAFDARSHHLVVADQAGGPGSRFADAAAAGRAFGGIAAVNAGFFTPEGAPLGLVVAAGTPAGGWNSASSLGSAGWFRSAGGASGIARRDALGREQAKRMRDYLQAGPLLVENERAVAGLDAEKTSVRTILLWDGGHGWWMGRSSPCTLATLARALAAGSPASWPVRQALNLDGGRSSDLWISHAVAGGPLTRRTPWNRPVRNFLVLVP